jgi:hypothetical protein
VGRVAAEHDLALFRRLPLPPQDPTLPVVDQSTPAGALILIYGIAGSARRRR